jgi:hypothetical protein
MLLAMRLPTTVCTSRAWLGTSESYATDRCANRPKSRTYADSECWEEKIGPLLPLLKISLRTFKVI